MGLERRKPLQLKAKLPDLNRLLKLLGRLPPCFRVVVEGIFGKILDLLTIKVQSLAITSLVQFYDPPLRTFLLQDFQLTPSLEEFEVILGFPMIGRIPYTKIDQVPKEKESLVPTLHLRHENRKGTLLYCLPLLYNWLTSLVFNPNSYIR
ncbi:hypothetical protein KIW84_065403 [Lathyrus oleraceus]|uniref:DUF7745 domain-containing protein n=1 Tax=Pisum sativum TaxID=3888 RepID=A0A9D4WFC8_PEA|nr:hypothetical protein KIW84_065403 [Pisum sativum]